MNLPANYYSFLQKVEKLDNFHQRYIAELLNQYPDSMRMLRDLHDLGVLRYQNDYTFILDMSIIDQPSQWYSDEDVHVTEFPTKEIENGWRFLDKEFQAAKFRASFYREKGT